MQKRITHIIQVVIILFLIVSTDLLAENYHTLKSKHFYVHYPVELQKKQAEKILFWAEGAYAKLRTVFNYDLDPVHIHVHNKIDTPNGSAVTVLFNKINVYLAAAPYDSPIGAETWMQNLLTHELTHIFTLDASRGYSSVLRAIFGKPLLPFTTPNYTTPLWFHEGTAVFNESRYATGGRLNTTLYEAYYRKNVIYNDFPHISKLNTYYSNDTWPFGSTTYIYGAGLVNTIHDYIQKNPTGLMASVHAGRFYYFYNFGSETLLKQAGMPGKKMSYTDFYELFKRNEIKRHTEKLAKLKTLPLSKPQLLYNSKTTIPLYAAFIQKQQTIYFTAYNPADRKGIYSYNVKTGDTACILKNSGLGNWLQPDKSGNYLYFTLHKKSNEKLFAVPYTLNLKTLEAKQVNNFLERMITPAPSPDNETIAGITLDHQGQKHLVLYNTRTRQTRKLLHNTTAINPVFLAKDLLAVFEYDFTANKTACMQIDTKTGTSSILFSITGKVTTPSTSSGTLYFSCDKNGVFNIYSLDLKTKTVSIHTNLDTAGFSPAVNGKTLFFLYLGRNGNTISSLPATKITVTELPDISEKRLAVEPVLLKKTDYTLSENYTGLSYLSIHGWMPYFYSDSVNNNAGALTAWTDPLYFHQVVLAGHYSLNHKDPHYFAYYSYLAESGFLATVTSQKTLTVYNKNTIPANQDYSYYQQEYLNSAFLGYSLNTLDFSFSVKLGGVYTHWSQKDKDTNDPLDYYQGDFYGPKAIVSFHNRDFHLTSLRPVNGIYLNCQYTYFLKPAMQEVGADLFLSLGGIIFNNDVITSKHVIRGTSGEKTIQGYYSLGGMPFFFMETGASLRGYDTGYLIGYNYYLGNLEYSFQLFSLFKGWGTKPLFLKSAYITLFYDYAQLSENGFRDLNYNEFITSYGAELGLASLLIYHVPVDFVFGFARAHHTAENSYYFSVKIPLGEQISFFDYHVKNKFYSGQNSIQ